MKFVRILVTAQGNGTFLLKVLLTQCLNIIIICTVPVPGFSQPISCFICFRNRMDTAYCTTDRVWDAIYSSGRFLIVDVKTNLWAIFLNIQIQGLDRMKVNTRKTRVYLHENIRHQVFHIRFTQLLRYTAFIKISKISKIQINLIKAASDEYIFIGNV